jgi:hypothetical protein
LMLLVDSDIWVHGLWSPLERSKLRVHRINSIGKQSKIGNNHPIGFKIGGIGQLNLIQWFSLDRLKLLWREWDNPIMEIVMVFGVYQLSVNNKPLWSWKRVVEIFHNVCLELNHLIMKTIDHISWWVVMTQLYSTMQERYIS